MMVPSLPSFCAPKYRDGNNFLKLLSLVYLTFLIFALPTISCIKSPLFEIPSVVWAFLDDTVIFPRLISYQSWVYIHQGSIKDQLVRLIWKCTDTYLFWLISRLSCMLLGVHIKDISFILPLFKDYKKIIIQKKIGSINLSSLPQRGGGKFSLILYICL